MKTKLYLDVDGVLLTNIKDTPTIILANYIDEFLTFILDRFDCYWLTTHCKNIDNTNVLNYLKTYCDESIFKKISKIKAVEWKTLKTEAIDISSKFFWIDDAPLYMEVELLKKHNLEKSFININTKKNSDDLLRAIKILERSIN
jgi:hypothetical protein